MFIQSTGKKYNIFRKRETMNAIKAVGVFYSNIQKHVPR